MSSFSAVAKTTGWINDFVRRSPLLYPSIAQTYERVAAMSEAELRNWSDERLRQTLQQAARSRYGSTITVPSDLAAWPILEKASLRQAPARFIRGGRLLTLASSTGGTTGTPLRLVRSPSSVVAEQAALDRLFLRGGIDPRRCRIAVLRGDSLKDPSDMTPPFWRYVDAGRRLLLSAHHLAPATADAYHNELVRFRPDVLMAYPSALEALCHLFTKTDRHLDIDQVITSSEMLTPASWHLAEAVLNARVIDRYGQAERVAFAYGVSPSEYYFMSGYGHVELIPLDEGAPHGLYELIATPFWNNKMPLIRYRTGDLIRVAPETTAADLERIRLGRAPFAGIQGRQSDYVVSPDGARLVAMNHLPREVSHIVQMQVIQETRERVRILVVPADGFGTDDERTLLRNAASKLPKSMHVTVETVEALQRTALGKVPFVIREAGVESVGSQ